MTTDTTDVPVAPIVARRGRRVEVRCPYCGGVHSHELDRAGAAERHAPGCGLYLSPQHRITGYVIRPEVTSR